METQRAERLATVSDSTESRMNHSRLSLGGPSHPIFMFPQSQIQFKVGFGLE